MVTASCDFAVETEVVEETREVEEDDVNVSTECSSVQGLSKTGISIVYITAILMPCFSYLHR